MIESNRITAWQPCPGKQPASQATILAARHSKLMAWIAAWPGKATLPGQATKHALKISGQAIILTMVLKQIWTQNTRHDTKYQNSIPHEVHLHKSSYLSR